METGPDSPYQFQTDSPKPGEDELNTSKEEQEIEKIKKEMEQSKKTIEQLEKEQEMLLNLEKERDRLNSIVDGADKEPPVREMEEGEISDSDEEIVLSDGNESDFSPESPQAEPNETLSTKPESIIPLDRLESDGEASSTDDEVEILEETPAGTKPKEFRKYWEDFEGEGEEAESKEKKSGPKVSFPTKVPVKEKTPNEDFWKAALLNIEEKIETELESSLFQRRKDLANEESVELFTRRSDLSKDVSEGISARKPSPENVGSRRSSVEINSVISRLTSGTRRSSEEDIRAGLFSDKVKETLAKALQSIREKETPKPPEPPILSETKALTIPVPVPVETEKEKPVFQMDPSWTLPSRPANQPTQAQGVLSAFIGVPPTPAVTEPSSGPAPAPVPSAAAAAAAPNTNFWGTVLKVSFYTRFTSSLEN